MIMISPNALKNFCGITTPFASFPFDDKSEPGTALIFHDLIFVLIFHDVLHWRIFDIECYAEGI